MFTRMVIRVGFIPSLGYLGTDVLPLIVSPFESVVLSPSVWTSFMALVGGCCLVERSFFELIDLSGMFVP